MGSTTIEQSTTTTVPRPRTASDATRQLADALLALGPALDPGPEARERSRARIAAALRAS